MWTKIFDGIVFAIGCTMGAWSIGYLIGVSEVGYKWACKVIGDIVGLED